MNGTVVFSMVDNNNFTSNSNLTISNESTPTNNAAFGGYIAYFTWVKGTALYTSDFTVSNTYPSITNNYVLLLTSSSSSGTLGNTVVNNNVSTVQNVPVGFLTSSSQPTTISMKSLFTDNSRVYYKPGSLAAGGVGSVRNLSSKARRI